MLSWPLGCEACNHFEGSLRGFIAQTGPLYGATVLATYAGDLPTVPCPSLGAPQGLVILAIDGVVIIPCLREFFPFPGVNTVPGATTAD